MSKSNSLSVWDKLAAKGFFYNTDPKKSYFVRFVINQDNEKLWLCGCRAFLFGKRKDKLCRHIDEAIIKKNKGEKNDKEN